MRKVTIFGTGNMGARIAFFLARSRDVARIRLVDTDESRARAAALDFLESNIALKSKIEVVDYDEPKEIELSDAVIVAAGVKKHTDDRVEFPTDADIARMEEIGAHIGHFAPQTTVAVLSQPAEIFCPVIAKAGYLKPEQVFGFPLLIYREWYRDGVARAVGLSNQDIRITTVRTMAGEELVPAQCAVSGIPLLDLIEDATRLPPPPSHEVMEERLARIHYAPAAVVSEVASEIVGRRRQVVTAICPDPESGLYTEGKAVIGPGGFEKRIPLLLTHDQKKRHQEYVSVIEELSKRLS